MENEKKEEHQKTEHHTDHHKEENVHHKATSKKFKPGNIFIALAIVLGIILIVNIYLTFNINKDLAKGTEALKDKLRPARIELTVIKNSQCNDCLDISSVISHIKNLNVNITKQNTVEFNSMEGKDIINKYKILKIPTIVVKGEIDKVNIQGLNKKDDALLLTNLEPPYTNPMTGKIEGRVIVYILMDSHCDKCNNLTVLINQIKNAGIKFSEQRNIDVKGDEGKALIKKYNIDFAPSLVLSKDAEAYTVIQKAWPQVGTKESDGSYVLRLVNPPYINLTTMKLRGMVNIIYLSDKSCTECYDVILHKEILTSPQSFAMKFDREETLDISDARGKELIANYNITKVPTVILSDEAGAYPIKVALRQFYSFEKDGSYVFRALSALGVYKDLTTNQVVRPQKQNQNQVA